jgi:hypothetical protein
MLTVDSIMAVNILMTATLPRLLLEVYHFSSGMVGLAYIGSGVGYLLAVLFGSQISGKIYSTVSVTRYQ